MRAGNTAQSYKLKYWNIPKLAVKWEPQQLFKNVLLFLVLMAVRATESEKLMEHIWSWDVGKVQWLVLFFFFLFFKDLWMVEKNQKKEKA